MTFRRSDAGLSNHHLFYSVHVVMYVEGGVESLSFQDLEEGGGEASTLDVAYWRGVIGALGIRKKIRILSIGSKKTLHDIAGALRDGRVKNVYVGMDRDFDVDSATLAVPGVMCTAGYSWENDVWGVDTFVDVLNALCPQVEVTSELIDEVNKRVQKFFKDVRWGTAADRALALGGLDRGVFSKPGLVLRVRDGEWPVVERAHLKPLLVAARLRLRASGIKPSARCVNSQKDCHGKLVASYFYFMFVRMLQCNGIRSQISRTLVDGAALSGFLRRLMGGGLNEIVEHYRPQFVGAGAFT